MVQTRGQFGSYGSLLVILIVVTVPLLRSGYNLPDVMTFFLGAGVAGTQAARPRAALPAGGGQW